MVEPDLFTFPQLPLLPYLFLVPPVIYTKIPFIAPFFFL
jgi:hypothetical protein